MGWNHSKRFVPRLRTYKEALGHYNHVVPLRHGRRKGVRPVGDRRNTGQTITLVGEKVVVEYYNSATVTYTPDNVVEVRSGYTRSPSVRGFLSALLSLNIFSYDCRVYCTAWATPEGEEHYGDYVFFDGIRFRFVNEAPEPRGQLYITKATLLNPKREYRPLLNRRGAAAVRARYAGLLDHVSGLVKLMQDYKKEERPHWRQDDPKWSLVTAAEDVRRAWSDDRDAWRAFSPVGGPASLPQYVERMQAAYEAGGSPAFTSAVLEMAGFGVDLATYLYRAHLLEAYKCVPVPWGEKYKHARHELWSVERELLARTVRGLT